jgi:zinc transport system substrate-binding protein
MNKNILALAILTLGFVGAVIFWVSLSKKATTVTDTSASPRLSVVTSFYPLANFAENIGGEKVTVVNITPAGAEPHDYEPTPQDLVKIQAAGVFIYNGNGLDEWAEKIAPELSSKGVTVVKISDSLQSLPGGEHEEDGHEEAEGDEDEIDE